MKIRAIITSWLVSCSVLIPSVGAAAGFQDQQVEQVFKQGKLRLSKSLFGKGVGGGEALNQLFKDAKWEELVEAVLAKRFVQTSIIITWPARLKRWDIQTRHYNITA
jgi:hypothetical protein